MWQIIPSLGLSAKQVPRDWETVAYLETDRVELASSCKEVEDCQEEEEQNQGNIESQSTAAQQQ